MQKIITILMILLLSLSSYSPIPQTNGLLFSQEDSNQLLKELEELKLYRELIPQLEKQITGLELTTKNVIRNDKKNKLIIGSISFGSGIVVTIIYFLVKSIVI